VPFSQAYHITTFNSALPHLVSLPFCDLSAAKGMVIKMSRLSNLLIALPEKADGILVTSPINQRYLTGFNYSDGYVLVTRGASYLLADSRYYEAAKNSCSSEFEVVLIEGDRNVLLRSLLVKSPAAYLCYEDRSITCAGFEGLRKGLPDVEFIPCGGLFTELRAVKERCETDKIIAAQRIADACFNHVLNYIRRDITERQLALEIELFMRKNGSEGVAFDIIAVSGQASSLPHGVPRDIPLESGPLTMDFGAVIGGYRSDMTRTVFIGEPSDEIRNIYETVLAAQTTALSLIKPGAKCSDIDAAARKVIDDAGYGKNFGHSLGHGVGLEIHEAPRLAHNDSSQLVPGNVVTVEPGIYLEGRFGVRIEDMAHVTEGGMENLTRAPKDLLVLCR